MYIQLWTIVCSIIFSRKLWKYHSQSKLRFDFDFLNFIQPYFSFNFEIFFFKVAILNCYFLSDFEYFQNFLNFTTRHLHFETLNFFLVFINWSELRNIFEILLFKVNLVWTFENFFEIFQLEVWSLIVELWKFLELNLYIWLNIPYTCWIIELLLIDVTVLTPLYMVGSFPHSQLQTKLFQIFSDLILIQWKFEVWICHD